MASKKKGKQMDPKELEDKVKELEKYKKEEEKAKMKEEAVRFKELKHAKKSLQTEIVKTKRVTKKKEVEVNDVTKICNKLQEQGRSSTEKQDRLDQSFQKHIETVTEKQADFKTDMNTKMDDIGYVKGRLAHLNFALKSLENNMIVPFESTAPPPGAKGSQGAQGAEPSETEALQQEVEDLRDESTHLEEENRLLREELEAARAALRQDVEACEAAKSKAAAAASAAATAAANAAAVASKSAARSPSPVPGSNRDVRVPITAMAGVRTTVSPGVGRQRMASPIGSPQPPLLSSSHASPVRGATYSMGGQPLLASSGQMHPAAYTYGAPPPSVIAGGMLATPGGSGGMFAVPGVPVGAMMMRSTSPGPQTSPRPASTFPWQGGPQYSQTAPPGVSPLTFNQGFQFGGQFPPSAQPLASPTAFAQGAQTYLGPQAYPGPSPRSVAAFGGLPTAPPPAVWSSAPLGSYIEMPPSASSAGTVMTAGHPISNFGHGTPVAVAQAAAGQQSQRQISSGPGQAGNADSVEQWVDRRTGETRHRGSFVDVDAMGNLMGGSQIPPTMPKPNATPAGAGGEARGGGGADGGAFSFAQIAHKATAAALREYRETHTGA